jgi:hypothetical protein
MAGGRKGWGGAGEGRQRRRREATPERESGWIGGNLTPFPHGEAIPHSALDDCSHQT